MLGFSLFQVDDLDVIKIVNHLRQQRPAMVQTKVRVCFYENSFLFILSDYQFAYTVEFTWFVSQKLSS